MRQSDTQRMPEVYTDFRRTAVEAWSMRNTYTAAECAAHAPGDDPAGEQRLVLFQHTYPHYTTKGAPLPSPTYL